MEFILLNNFFESLNFELLNMDLELLYRQIRGLPHDIQILIDEYNVEHRRLVKKINEEYFSIIYYDCISCNKPFKCDLFWSVDYFINRKYNLNNYWCSSICYHNSNDEHLKNKFLACIEDYLLHTTIFWIEK